jgi:hypothetical protein
MPGQNTGEPTRYLQVEIEHYHAWYMKKPALDGPLVPLSRHSGSLRLCPPPSDHAPGILLSFLHDHLNGYLGFVPAITKNLRENGGIHPVSPASFPGRKSYTHTLFF